MSHVPNTGIVYTLYIETSKMHKTSGNLQNIKTWPQGYKTFFMLKSVEHKIQPAQKC